MQKRRRRRKRWRKEARKKTRWAKNGGAQAEEEEGAIAKWSPNANGLKTEEEEERLPGETQRLPHARGGDPSHRGCHC